jgi:hypothetical protein
MVNQLVLFLHNFAISDAECRAEQSQKLLGVIPKWYAYLKYGTDPLDPNHCKILIDFSGNGILGLLPVGLAIIEILTTLAGVVAVGFVIYGGVRYVLSQGEPENTAAARSTIINALIGAVIAAIASAIVAFIGKSLK